MYFGRSKMCNLACIAYYTCASHVIIVSMATPSTGLRSERALTEKTNINLEYQAEFILLSKRQNYMILISCCMSK